MPGDMFKKPTTDLKALLQTAVKGGRKALSEYQSKLFLSRFGLPVTREILTTDLKKTLDAAVSIGYPVALKACGAQLMHKSDKGLVALRLAGEDDITNAFHQITSAAGDDLEGILVQEMVPGNRELVVGLIRDPQFGPCVMLGLGGVMTEIYKDTVFRMAPVCRTEALDMLTQLRAKEILGAFRGQAAADRDTICRCIMGVGELGLQFDEIAEIDVNPLIISEEGRIVAADALIIVKEAERC